MKMLRFSLGKTKIDRIKNEFIRRSVHVSAILGKVRTRAEKKGKTHRKENREDGSCRM